MFAKELKKELAENKLLSNVNEQMLRNFLRKRFVDYKDKMAFITFTFMDMRLTDSLLCLPITLFDDVKAWLEINGFKVESEKSNVNSASIQVYLD